jgi:hypothetical protein
MYLKKGICSFLFATAILATPVALDWFPGDNWGKTQADGGGPTPPPIPWPTTAIDSSGIIADGGGPTPPPVPWGSASPDMKFLRA